MPTKSMTFVSEVELSSGQIVRLDAEDILVVVGPNNSGKSQFLRDVYSYLINAQVGKVVKRAKRGVKGDVNGLLEQFSQFFGEEDDKGMFRIASGGSTRGPTTRQAFLNLLNSESQNFGVYSGLFIQFLTTNARLNATNEVPQRDNLVALPTSPLHKLCSEYSLEKKISDVFFEMFGEYIVTNKIGKVINLYLGNPESRDLNAPGAFEEREKDIAELPKVSDQGDGFKSLAGILLHLFAEEVQISLVDEPEAFLHPPQSYKLGQLLSRESFDSKQIIIATHSIDILQGIVSTNNASVKVVRLERDGDVNNVSELNSSDIREVWNDPILRYSNALDGLFHRMTIVCEADGDCRFFHAVMDAIDAQARTPARDVLFTHCGGKHRMHIIARALRALSVPVRIVPDIDILNNEDTISRLVEACGGNWQELKPNWKKVVEWIKSKSMLPSREDVKSQISNIIDAQDSREISSTEVQAIRKCLRKVTAWDDVKRLGQDYLPGGEIKRSFEALTEGLEAAGIFVNVYGELESLDVGESSFHGPEFVNVAIQKDLLREPSLQKARDFVTKILS